MFSPNPKNRVISTEAMDSLIVHHTAESPRHFVFVVASTVAVALFF
jgi:hypothetical protein